MIKYKFIEYFEEDSKDSESLTPTIDGWNQKYNEFMLARYFLGEVGAAEVDLDILTEIQGFPAEVLNHFIQ